jgi:lactoylglutathione lyase
MLRIKDPLKSVKFYTENFGFKLLHQYDFPEWKFSLYFLGILEEGQAWPESGTKESESALWSMKGSCLELTHNHGSEVDDSFAVNNGNVEPHRGFGHIAVMTPDVYKSAEELENNGVRFQKRPDEGRMKGIAFALDPDGYWVEIVVRSEASPVKSKYTLAQTMMRVKDPVKSLAFYRDILGMSLIRESRHSDFSLYFLAQLPPGTPLPDVPDGPEASEYIRRMFPQVLELTHNHGTENSAEFQYHNGNDQDEGQLRGFGHIGYLVDDLAAATTYFDDNGVKFKKRPEEGSMRGLAFVYDPDNYWVEIIQRNGLSITK